MQSSNKKSGFTLIEMLVVVSIIAILTGIILANLSASRNKGSDASVKTNMATIQTQAEVYFDQHFDSYGSNNNVISTCTNQNTLFFDTTIKSAIGQIKTNDGGVDPICLVGVKDTSTATPSTWALSAPLKSGGTWCVDSGGFAGSKTATQTGNSVSCT